MTKKQKEELFGKAAALLFTSALVAGLLYLLLK